MQIDRRELSLAEWTVLALVAPIVAAIDEQPDGAGFDATLHAWRRSAARATLECLDGLAS